VDDTTGAVADRPPHEADSAEWRKVLTEGHGSLVRARHVFRYLPSAPRCKVCNNPFRGVGGRALRLAGFRPSRKNPNLCTRCCDSLPEGGAEVDVAVLFADVRGSTRLGEQQVASDFAALLKRFYVSASDALLSFDAVVDKLIGDEVMAFFVRGISGDLYRRQAVRAGMQLLREVGYGSAQGPWIELGVAVNAGPAYVGNVGGAVVDFTALGDPVNIAARLQRCAQPGQLLVGAGVDDELLAGAPRHTFPVRGSDRSVDAFVLGAEVELPGLRE
jgi:adenylate cyclase